MNKIGRYTLGLSGFAFLASAGVYTLRDRQLHKPPHSKDKGEHKMAVTHSFQVGNVPVDTTCYWLLLKRTSY